MSWTKSLKGWRSGIGPALVAAILYAASMSLVTGADTRTKDSQAAKVARSETARSAVQPGGKADPKPAGNKDPEARTRKAQALTGAELYAINCNRCHAERYPTEWTAAQWKTLMLHMRVRANLPAAQARKILKYLQEDSGQ